MANMDGYDAMALPYMGSPMPAISHGDFMAPMAPMEMPQPSPYDETFPRYLLLSVYCDVYVYVGVVV